MTGQQRAFVLGDARMGWVIALFVAGVTFFGYQTTSLAALQRDVIGLSVKVDRMAAQRDREDNIQDERIRIIEERLGGRNQ